MRPTIRERIIERYDMSDARLKNQGWLERVANRVGLFVANSIDILTAWADDNRVIFMGATAAGFARGAAYGVVAGVLAAGLLPLGAAATPVFLTLVAAGAVGYGLYDGQHELENHLNARNPRMSDDTAKLFGTIPGRPFHPTPNVKLPTVQNETAMQSADDCDCAPVVINQTNKPVEVVVTDNDKKFTTRVDASRAAVTTLDR
jgi:hypothetical protein